MTDEQEKVEAQESEEAPKEQPIEVAPTERITKSLACGHTVTICGRVRMRDIRKWTDAENSGDWLTCYKYLAAIVVEWTFASDPTDPDVYDDLWPHEMRQVNAAVSQHITAQTASKN